MDYFVISDSGGGITIDGPKTREQVAAMLREPDDGGSFSRDPEVVAEVPTCDSGFFYLSDNRTKVLVIRGEIVARDDLDACPCGSGRAFKACHGAEQPEAGPCEHDRVFADHVLTSSPPQRPWICRKCKARGADTSSGRHDWGEYDRLSHKAQKGHR